MAFQTEIYYWGSTELPLVPLKYSRPLCSPRFLHYPHRILSITQSNSSTLILTDSGELFSASDPTTPAFQSLKNIKVTQISAGLAHYAILTQNFQVFTCGKGENGALGHGCTSDLQSPQRLELPKASQISCGDRHTAVLTSSGVYIWGCGSSGQLGLGNYSSSLSPLKLPIAETIKQVSCGSQHTLLLTDYSEILAFGGNSLGQLGNGSKKATNVPIAIEIACKFKLIAAGSHSAAIALDGGLYIWGTGLFGEWVNPKVVKEVNQVVQVVVVAGCGFAVDGDGKVWAWGDNMYGQLGLGDFDQRTGVSWVKVLGSKKVRKVCIGNNAVFGLGKVVEEKKWGRKNAGGNKENIGMSKSNVSSIEKCMTEKKERSQKTDRSLEDEMIKLQHENENFRNAFEELKAFKQQCYLTLTQEAEKRKQAESFVNELHNEHKMLVSTIEDLEKTMAKLSKQCEVYQEKAGKTDELILRIKRLSEENERLKSNSLYPEVVSKRYISDVSMESITMASPDVSLVFDKKGRREHSADCKIKASNHEFVKLFEAPEPIRSISPVSYYKESSEPQTPPTFRDGGINNSGAIKNSLSEIRARLNMLQENKVDLESKMNDFERKLKEQM